MVKLFEPGTRERFVDSVCGGMSLLAAAQSVGASVGSATRWWRQSGRMELALVVGRKDGGGLVAPIPPSLPGKPSSSCRRSLSMMDRSLIQAGRCLQMSYAQIGIFIGRDKSVVWREVNRSSSPDGVYYASVAHRLAAELRRRPKAFKLATNGPLCRFIEAAMDEGWSPGLIAGMLTKTFGDDHTWRVSHETIYQALYVQTRGELRADLHRNLSLKRANRRPQTRDRKASSPYKEAFTISDRPAEVDDRAVPGHWEGDLIVGPASKSAIGTLVERTTRFTILLYLPDRHDSQTVAAAMIDAMRDLPKHLRQSITWDRGSELAAYEDIQLALDTKLFFCDPHSPWQRGTNENTNRLLRFWFEKGSDLSVHSAEDLARVAAILNRRPRPTLNLKTPAQALNTLLKEAA
ncbi:IS30 family transposase [Aeromicrobium sp. UC242_57]|uniref:IS30 family transposase n=1 Tax=Aeromicrobium sp. UC242_57 TaxID=3374624 RepID=UPI0037949E4B